MANPQQVKRAIAVMLAAYPRANGGDQESMRQFLTLVENFLAQYPNEVLEAMVAPRTGIMSVCTHLPSIAEMKKFCDRKWDILSPRAVADNHDDIRQLYGPKSDPEHDAEHRARMVEKFKDLIHEISGKDKEPLMTKEEYQAKAEETLSRWAEEAKTKSPPKLSAAALATLNLPKEG
jgi:hypothetical protein